MDIHFYGATREVTGSCHLLRIGEHHILVDCGLIQGNPQHEEHNRDPFPFEPSEIDAVVLTHAHLDHSGRLPLLVKQGFKGPIHAHRATADLCRIMLEDAGYLNEKDAAWDNRKRERQGKEPVSPLYTQEEARLAHTQFRALEYGKTKKIVHGIKLTLLDAGHILGSAIVKLELKDGNQRHSGAPRNCSISCHHDCRQRHVHRWAHYPPSQTQCLAKARAYPDCRLPGRGHQGQSFGGWRR